jgi:hypothetical protein
MGNAFQEFGLLPLAYRAGQRLHACSEEGEESDRVFYFHLHG